MLEFCPIVHTAIAIAAPQLCRVGRNEPYINMFVVFMVWCVYSIYSRQMTIHPFVGGVYTLPANPTLMELSGRKCLGLMHHCWTNVQYGSCIIAG